MAFAVPRLARLNSFRSEENSIIFFFFLCCCCKSSDEEEALLKSALKFFRKTLALVEKSRRNYKGRCSEEKKRTKIW
jgi:hypothetical protein